MDQTPLARNAPGRTLLLVEDDRALQRAWAEALHDAGFTVLAEHDGDWARTTFGSRAVDMVVADVLLPRRTGLQLAADVRRSPRGRDVPILLVSGIYDGARVREPLAALGGFARFEPKPLSPARLVALCREALGLDDSTVRRRRIERARLDANLKDLSGLADRAEAREVESDSQVRFRGAKQVRGNLARTPFAEVLSELHRWRANGALLLQHAPVKKVVFLKDGTPVNVRSNLLAEALGQLLVRERMINVAECEQALARAQSSRRQLGTELIEMRIISPANLAYALQLQLETKIFELFTWTDGEYGFEPRADLPALPVALDWTAARLLLEGVRRTVDDARALTLLREVETAAVRLTDDPLDRFQETGLDGGEARLFASIDGRRTLRELLDAGIVPEADARRVLYALRCANMLRFGGAAAEARHPELVARLQARADELRGLNFYDALGVRPDATAQAVQLASESLAREAHPDRLPPGAPEKARELATAIFELLTLAGQTLRDPHRRADYELRLARGEAGGDAREVSGILSATRAFREGEALLAEGQALPAQQKFAEAVRLRPAEAEFHALLGWAIWSAVRDEAGALRSLSRALQLNPRLDRAYLFRGRIARALGRGQEAEAEFVKALACNPACAEALEELRLGGA